jgi:hypothetical protein
MLRYAARASSDVFLCSLRSSRRADTGTYPLLCFTVSVRKYNGVDARKYFGLYLSYTKKCLFCGIRTIPDIITKYTKHLPTMSSEQLVDHSAQPVRRNARRTVQPTPRVEQNPALLRCGRLLKSGRGLRYDPAFRRKLLPLVFGVNLYPNDINTQFSLLCIIRSILIQIQVFWGVIPCRLVNVYLLFEGA